MFDLTKYRSVLLKQISDNVLVSEGCNSMNPVSFLYELLTLYSFHNFLNSCWLFYYNYKDPYINTISFRKTRVSNDIIFWLVDIGQVVIFTGLYNNANRSTSCWEINSDFKYIIFDEWVIWDINFNVGRVEIIVPVISSYPGDHNLPNLLAC